MSQEAFEKSAGNDQKNHPRKLALQKLLLAFGIVVPSLLILSYCVPLIPIGTKSLSMIRYFDRDESALIDFAIRLYDQGIVPQEMESSYPRFFYYLCGLFLYPYTFLFGPSAEVIAITFRIGNTCAMVFTAIMINLIGVRFFKSTIVGSLSALLFILTPSFLHWGVNSRPHPTEILFIILSIYYSLISLETRQTHPLWKAVLFAGLALGTKFGGIFLLPTIVLVYAYLLWNKDLKKTHLKPESRIGTLTSLSLITAGFGILLFVQYVIFFVKRSSTGLSVSEELGWLQAIASKPFNLGILVGITLFSIGIIFFKVNRKMVNLYEALSEGSQIKSESRLFTSLFVYKVFLFSAKISSAALVLSLLTNFDFLVFPKQNIFILIRRFLLMFLGEHFHRDPNYWKWFTLFPSKHGMGVGGVLILIYYVFRECPQIRSNFQGEKSQEFIFRLVPLSYVIVLFSSLMFCINYRFHRFLLPIYLFLFMLGIDSLVRTPKKLNQRFHRQIYLGICLSAVLFCISERIPTLIASRASMKARISDPVVVDLAPWLASTYPKSVRIMSDDTELYIPESFENLSYWKAAQRQWSLPPGISANAYHGLSEYNPEIFIRSNFARIDTTWTAYNAEIEFLDTNYSIVKRMLYHSKAKTSHRMNELVVVIYEKNSKSQDISKMKPNLLSSSTLKVEYSNRNLTTRDKLDD